MKKRFSAFGFFLIGSLIFIGLAIFAIFKPKKAFDIFVDATSNFNYETRSYRAFRIFQQIGKQ